VAPIVIGITVHFRFHICCISILKFLHFNFISAYFCTTFLFAGIATSIGVYVVSFCLLLLLLVLPSGWVLTIVYLKQTKFLRYNFASVH
jgi:hypothetical protein